MRRVHQRPNCSTLTDDSSYTNIDGPPLRSLNRSQPTMVEMNGSSNQLQSVNECSKGERGTLLVKHLLYSLF